MNYYATLYNDELNPDHIKVHVFVVEGIYEANGRQKARVIGNLNITDNRFYKMVKQPYDVINEEEYTITLKEQNYNNEIRKVVYEKTYTLLSHLLTNEGHSQERIEQITSAIHNISNNRSIKTDQNFCGTWINI
jgi:hypothetical protein